MFGNELFVAVPIASWVYSGQVVRTIYPWQQAHRMRRNQVHKLSGARVRASFVPAKPIVEQDYIPASSLIANVGSRWRVATMLRLKPF